MYSQERWEHLLELSPFDTMEQLRDQMDQPGWRARDAQRELAESRRGEPPREVPSDLGSLRGRPSKQINVKLARVDFDGLVALAVDRDLPPSSMARVLLRQAILDACAD